ncbi:hypothetical protein RSAG8_11345, partial [Rhizoctonia solani AG-8 WAC10335]
MPVLTREMIRQQQLARNAARLPAPSAPSSHSSSPTSSLSRSPASMSSSLGRLPAPSSREYSRPDKCRTPTLDEVSRAHPGERARSFARLPRKEENNAENVTPRTPERRVKTSTPRHSPAKPAGHSSTRRDDLDDPPRMEIDEQQMFPEWMADDLEALLTSSLLMGGSPLLEEADEELQTMEREATNKLRQLGYNI